MAGEEAARAPAPARVGLSKVEIEIVRDGEGGADWPWSVRRVGTPGTRHYAADAEAGIRFVNAELRRSGQPSAAGPEISIVVREPEPAPGSAPARARWKAKRRVGGSLAPLYEFRYVEARDKREALQLLYVEVASASRTPTMLDRVGRSVHTDGYQVAWYLENKPEPEE